MRIFIILLVIANLLFMGVSYFITEPQKVAAKTEERKDQGEHSLVLLSELEKGALMVDPVERGPGEPSRSNRRRVTCLKIVGDWDLDELALVKEKIKSLGKSVISEGKERRKKVSYWVVIPSFASKQEAIIAKREFQNAKIVDTFVIKRGVRENGLSLGLYSNMEGAMRRVRHVNDNNPGIARAIIDELILYVDRFWIKVTPVDAERELITSAIGGGIIATEVDQCEIDR